jgi:hypothetical protein
MAKKQTKAAIKKMGRKDHNVLTLTSGTSKLYTATTAKPCTVMGYLEKLRRDADENRDLLRRQEEKAKEIAEGAGQIADAMFEAGEFKALFELNLAQRCPTVRMRVHVGNECAALDEEEVRALATFLGYHLSGK